MFKTNQLFIYKITEKSGMTYSYTGLPIFNKQANNSTKHLTINEQNKIKSQSETTQQTIRTINPTLLD